MTKELVLAVDDDPATLEVISAGLELFGYSVTVADSFQSAREFLAITTPSVLIADVRLKGFNGLELLLRAGMNYPATALIMVTGFADRSLESEAARHGITCLLKPFGITDLVEAIEAQKARRAANRPQSG